MNIKVPYGDGYLEANVDNKDFEGFIESQEWPPAADERQSIRQAIESPIDSKRLEDIVQKGDKVVIVINDITRPTPSQILVEEIVKPINRVGIPDHQIKLVVATGSHRPNTQEELIMMLGQEIINRFEIENHKCEELETLVYVGNTYSGLELYLNRTVVEADVLITTGVIVPHHTAGYSGGRKSILPGVAGLETLRKHHSLPIRPFYPSMGKMKDNPFHKESVYAAKIIGVDFIVNVIQNSKKQTVEAVAGDLVQAHERGVELSQKICTTKVTHEYDVVITSPGGFPRDINLYQAQKSVSPAEVLVKEGGVIILVAECRDGVEQNDFPIWLKAASTPEEVIERFKTEGYTVGSNKAFMIARALLKAKIIVVTDSIAEKELNEMFLMRETSLEVAIKRAKNIVGSKGKVVALPNANSVIPIAEVSS